MIYVSVEALVRRRPEVVWGFLTDVSGLTAWVEGLVEASAEGEPGVGMRVDVARGVRGRRVDATCEVTAWREPSMLALETRLPGLLVLDRAVLEPTAEGTHLSVASELVFGSALASFFARPRGLLGAPKEEHPAQGVYERSVLALVKRIEALSAAPYR